MGKSSSVAWAKRTVDECDSKAPARPKLGQRPSGFVYTSYHTEDPDLEYFDTSNVNCFDWPDPELADTLVQSYFDNIHRAFPIVEKLSFMTRYREFIRGSVDLQVEDVLWLGTLNTIFAISAVYAHLTRKQNRGHFYDHLIYLARAKVLCLDQGLLYEDARVQTTSALGLLCLYFITTGRLNRAWTIGGLAIRHALTLGLHVRSEAETLSDFDKEYRVRLWWSLYSLECLLNELTGRPSCISDRDISTPLPINVDDDTLKPGQTLYERGESEDMRRRPSATHQVSTGSGISQSLAYNFPVLSLPATSSTYFIYRTQLAIISHEIVTKLYCAATIKEKWAEVQETINKIDNRLEAWAENLPSEFSLEFDRWDEPDWSDPQVLPRMGLAMLYNSSRMILFRPFLCRFEGRIASQSERSKHFNRKSVEMCIHSARTMINLIGWSARNVEKLYAISPWWCTLHYICEALSVLILELAYQAQHLPSEAAYILDDAKKGIRWLVMMAGESISARKAWEIFDSLIRVVAPMINWSVFDLPTSAPIPPGYNWRRWSTASQASSFPAAQYPGPDPDPASSSSASSWQPTSYKFQPMATVYARPGYHEIAAGNPLDQTTAVQMFGSIGAVHGHYDDPWQHMFAVSCPSIVQNVADIHGGGVVMERPPVPDEGAEEELGGGGGGGGRGGGGGGVGGGGFVGGSAAGGVFEALTGMREVRGRGSKGGGGFL
ncbi:hypothetical protein QTJ16_000322 [Diplocarpon rosae]|uniref:Xylanolytic transcriptional activator regulatory domain-containing protein n=1 Tax=Diplocarpon rosae TaxID=946125 RepID=A0AAD9T5Q0_9HELO|nr:hypothetical protein QTJ16_000322 [Diplocarpon rosae]